MANIVGANTATTTSVTIGRTIATTSAVGSGLGAPPPAIPRLAVYVT